MTSVASLEAAASGVVVVRRLDWDTAFFGAGMGTLEVRRSQPGAWPDLSPMIREARRDGYAHLVLRCGGDDWELVWAAERAGMRLVDVGLDLESPLDREFPRDGRAWQPADLETLRRIASTSFLHSRFAADPFFSGQQVAAFHAEWITNLCRGLADTVLVVGPPGSPLGFVACSVRDGIGRIPLIAVDGKARGRGVGHRLMGAAVGWFRDQRASAAWVKTQAQNHGALRLYARHGFLPARTELTFTIAPEAAGAQRGSSA